MTRPNLDIGHARRIIAECQTAGLLRNQAAYVLATAQWETNHTFEPVEEAYWLSDAWRKSNLRYYPWHGRGFVQLTWKRNYKRATEETCVNLIKNPAAAMLPDVAAQILVVGMRDGWFTGKRLSQYITLQKSNFIGARRIVNGTDKARNIAELAKGYDALLLAEGYGVDRMPATAPVTEKDERNSPVQSTTLWAAGTDLTTKGAIATGVMTQLQKFPTGVQYLIIGALAIGALATLWVIKERLRKWAEGDR